MGARFGCALYRSWCHGWSPPSYSTLLSLNVCAWPFHGFPTCLPACVFPDPPPLLITVAIFPAECVVVYLRATCCAVRSPSPRSG